VIERAASGTLGIFDAYGIFDFRRHDKKDRFVGDYKIKAAKRYLGLFFLAVFLPVSAVCGVGVHKSETVLADDGVGLASDVYLPAGEGEFACVLIRTPYDKTGHKRGAEFFLKNGVAVVAQDCRGRFLSGGEFYPFVNERCDGLATVKWIRGQEWSNGKVAGWGGSYVGYTQWVISDELCAISAYKTGSVIYELLYPEGLFSLDLAFRWGFAKDSKTDNNISPEKLAASYKILPLSVADDLTYRDSEFIDDWLSHPEQGRYWESQDHRRASSAAVISVGGWYDIFLMSQIWDFEALGEKRHPDSRLIIGPWAHGSSSFENDFGGVERTGRFSELMRSFIVKHLKGEDTGVIVPPFKDKKYNLFIMGRNEYYGCDRWPPAESSFAKYYLGTERYLGTEVPAGEGLAEYTYDPAEPFPSKGGTSLGVGVGQALQNENSGRGDQVSFETGALESPVVLLGPVSAELYVSSNAACTDFFVLLQDVYPDGKIINIQEGGKTVTFDKPGVQKARISVWATGYELEAGHKLRAVITSAWFPRFNRSLNTCEPIFSARKIKKAHQKVHFGPEHRSHLVLPILKLGTAIEK